MPHDKRKEHNEKDWTGYEVYDDRASCRADVSEMRIAGRHGSTCVAEIQKVFHNGQQPSRYELVDPAAGGDKPAPLLLVPVLIPSPAIRHIPLYTPSKPLVYPLYLDRGGLQGAYRGFTRGIQGV